MTRKKRMTGSARGLFTGMTMVVILAGCIAGCSGGDGAQEVRTEAQPPEWYVPEDLGDQYWRETMKRFNALWDNEKDHIEDLTGRIAATLSSGNSVIWDANASHFSLADTDPELPCLPEGGMQSSTAFQGNVENIDRLGPGDILVTTFIHKATADAFKRGVHVVGVTNSYFKCSLFSDADNNDHKPNYEDLTIEDISTELFNSRLDGQVGIVEVPWITDRKVGPGVGNQMGLLYWLSVCEVANKLTKGADAPPLEYATKYMDTLTDRLGSIRDGQHDAIRTAAAEVAQRIGNGAHYYLESDPESVKWSGTGMSMGLMMTNFKRSGADAWEAGDVLVLADVTDDPDSRIVGLARTARERGLYIVAICPATQTALRDFADVSFDNLSPEGYGVFEIPGHDNRIGLMGSLVNNVIYNTFAMQMVHEMARRGWYATFFSSYMWVKSSEYHEWAMHVVDTYGY